MAKISLLGKEIRKARIDRGMTMEQMSRLMGVSRAYVSAIETGVRQPTVRFVRCAAKALDLTELERDNFNRAYRQTKIDVFMNNLVEPL